MIFFYDTETTGLPLFKEPSEDPRQPHIVQACGLLVCPDTRAVVASFDAIVRPDGWEIPQDVADIHGITTEHALRYGIPEGVVVDTLFEMATRAQLRVGHNESFDARILRIGMKRHLGDDYAEAFKAIQAACTCWAAMPLTKLPRPGRGGFKLPKLEEAVRILLGRELEGAHSARADTEACRDLYFWLQDNGAKLVKEDKPVAIEPVAAGDDEVGFG